MKRCTRCKENKPCSEFNKQSKRPDGLHSYCKRCALEYGRERRAKNPNLAKDYYSKNKDAINEWRRGYRKKNPYSSEDKRKWFLSRHYKMTLERYDEMFKEQGGVCAIKDCESDNGGKWLVVDHDHSCCPGMYSCGECVRGLLCTNCNLAIGNMHDNPEKLISAAEYLKGFVK